MSGREREREGEGEGLGGGSGGEGGVRDGSLGPNSGSG